MCLIAPPLAVRAADPDPAASSVTLNFQPPKGWTETHRTTGRPGLWRDWLVQDGDVLHSLVVSVTREDRTAIPYGENAVATIKSIAGISQVTSAPATVCGDVPAYTYTYRSDRTAGHPLIIRHLLVDIGPMVGDVSYARPPEAADRTDALDAMSTFCDQKVYAMRAPAGWKSMGMSSPGNPGIGAFTSPSGDGTMIGLAVAMPVRAAAALQGPTQLKNGATLISDADETCGSIHVRHARWRGDGGKGPQVVETVAGYRHGTSYMYTYTRPESTPADPEAERALTSFCDAGAALATPAPR
jgi:hypothetical protein